MYQLDAIRHVINSAMGCVNLRELIEKIVQVKIVDLNLNFSNKIIFILIQDPFYLSEESIGEIRNFLLEILQMYHYEETLMKSTCRFCILYIEDL